MHPAPDPGNSLLYSTIVIKPIVFVIIRAISGVASLCIAGLLTGSNGIGQKLDCEGSQISVLCLTDDADKTVKMIVQSKILVKNYNSWMGKNE